jgi:hypothetical protein
LLGLRPSSSPTEATSPTRACLRRLWRERARTEEARASLAPRGSGRRRAEPRRGVEASEWCGGGVEAKVDGSEATRGLCALARSRCVQLGAGGAGARGWWARAAAGVGPVDRLSVVACGWLASWPGTTRASRSASLDCWRAFAPLPLGSRRLAGLDVFCLGLGLRTAFWFWRAAATASVPSWRTDAMYMHFD